MGSYPHLVIAAPTLRTERRATKQASPTPVTADTLLQVGSTGKTLTTLLLARLADQGLISWDTPVTQLLPTFTLADPAQGDAITVRHLVCNCSGVPRNDDVLQFQGAALDPQTLITSTATLSPTLALGEHYQYSNQMVAVGGFAAAAAVNGSAATRACACSVTQAIRLASPQTSRCCPAPCASESSCSLLTCRRRPGRAW